MKNRLPDPVLTRNGERWVPVGKVVGTHGVRGELRIHPFNPESTVMTTTSGCLLLPAAGGESVEKAIEGKPRRHQAVWLVRLGGVSTREDARELRGSIVAVRENELEPLGEGEFYHYELIGLEVVDERQGVLGTIREVIREAASDLLAVEYGDRECLIPVVPEIFLGIDREAGRVTVRVPDGLLDL